MKDVMSGRRRCGDKYLVRLIPRCRHRGNSGFMVALAAGAVREPPQLCSLSKVFSAPLTVWRFLNPPKSPLVKMGLFQQFLVVPPFSKGGLEGIRMMPLSENTFEPLAKVLIDNHCHSERSEESRIFRGLRSFTPFRMTEKRLLQEALLANAIYRLPKVLSSYPLSPLYRPGT
jgi:hypothetical protein